MSGSCLERHHILVDRAAERKPRQFGQVIGAERRAETLLTHAAKVRLGRATHVCLQDHVPLEGYVLEVI